MKGGVRVGAGRKAIENKKVQIALSVTKEQKGDKVFIQKLKDFIAEYDKDKSK